MTHLHLRRGSCCSYQSFQQDCGCDTRCLGANRSPRSGFSVDCSHCGHLFRKLSSLFSSSVRCVDVLFSPRGCGRGPATFHSVAHRVPSLPIRGHLLPYSRATHTLVAGFRRLRPLGRHHGCNPSGGPALECESGFRDRPASLSGLEFARVDPTFCSLS